MTERGKRDPRAGGPPLAGGGPSIVGVSGAMRARDVSRVREKDAAAAEKRLVIKRNPPGEPPPKKKRPPASETRTPESG